MLGNCLLNYNFNAYSTQHISFGAAPKPFKNPIKPRGNAPYSSLPGISEAARDFFEKTAYKKGVSNDDLLRSLLKNLPPTPNVTPMASKSAIVGNTRIHTLIDGEQIFNKTIEYIKSAQKSIQVEMFEFQNLSVDGDKWMANGAEKVPGAKQQQQILWMLINKKKQHPDMKIQVILDSHKWYIDGRGQRVRHYGNQDMIKYLKQNNIDVVPYPKASQQGASLQHIKLLIVDGKKAILGGMNWGTHSAANHDACVALETLAKKQNSEVDNLLDHHFNADWMFSWKKIGDTDLVPGPLSEEEQKYYNGLEKEIKQENVDYYNLLKEFFDTPEAKSRYCENRLDLIGAKPMANPAVKVLGTKPRELSEVGKSGDESAREYLLNKIKTCKNLKAELFVLTDKEIVETLIKRIKSGELDAKFVISSELLKFPYCRMAYHNLLENDIPVRVYKTDKSVNQRLHSKWAVFDDNEVLIGSTNWSGMGLNQNLKTGFRDDYELNSKKIEDELKEYAEDVNECERELGLPELKNVKDYTALLLRRKKIAKAAKDIEKNGKASMEFDGKTYDFQKDDISTVNTILGYYSLIKKRFNAKEKYKRGNNELSIVFESKSLAKVFINQLEKDWKYSKSEYDELKNKVTPIRRPIENSPSKPNLDKEG